MFDIKDFFPSITQDLLKKALNFAGEYIYISKCDIDVLNHARKSILSDGSHVWIKKQGGLLDVSMGTYGVARSVRTGGHIYVKYIIQKIQQKLF